MPSNSSSSYSNSKSSSEAERAGRGSVQHSILTDSMATEASLIRGHQLRPKKLDGSCKDKSRCPGFKFAVAWKR